MSTSAASLALPTFTSRFRPRCFARQALLSSHSSSLRLKSRPFSLSASFLRFHTPSPSRFIPSVALSSEFEQEEIVTDEDEPSYSPDLKLFVGNLPFSVDSAQLAELFESAGTVEMVEVIYDKMTGRSRGFGFVTMSTSEEVEAAAQQFNGYELDGRALRVNFGPPPRKENAPFRGSRGGYASDTGNRVHVGNLAWGVDNLALETLFAEQGKVLEAKVIYDRESGRSRGFGFVTYGSAEEVNGAIESLNGVDLNGRAIRVSLADAKPRRQF
ncbi:29 kDa ribonucleoprotein A, chloroplastic [Prosopis cineraria]|uniref:29 kDa ribonucleoprotein A, chloroplastic n=1 Tax=Prosopis cineraria TaxID=364024 RepID=UPI00240EFD4B|nr:29 kDa ribonucleoprotein A, chloroplastic [Prosopis cineraria]